MVICCFFGHDGIYDIDLADKLKMAVNQVVEENDTVEFFLYPNGDFFRLCLLTVLKVKYTYEKILSLRVSTRTGNGREKSRGIL